MSRAQFRLVLPSLVVALALVACGPDDDAPQTPSTGQAATPPEAATTTTDPLATPEAGSTQASRCAELQTDWSHANSPAGLRQASLPKALARFAWA